MKKIVYAAGLVIALASCSNATDGNAKTDTTTMPVDTAVLNNSTMDTGTSVNTNTGTYPTNDSASLRKPDANASTATDPNTRRSTAGHQKSADSGMRNNQ